MKSAMKIGLILLCAISFSNRANSQQIVTHLVNFESGLQSMWGPNGANFSINQTIPLFPEVNWNVPINAGGIVQAPLGLGSFGAELTGFFQGTIGCEFSLQGFTLGQIEVDYPIEITLDMPTDYTYDQGDPVVIETEYELEPGYALDTYYPSGGEAALDLYFGLGAGLSAEVCLFGCATLPIIPSFNTGIQNINIFTVNVNEVSFLSVNGGTPLYSYPIFPLNTSMIPGDPLGQFGLNGTLDIPNVVTSDNAVGNDLTACGESPYVNLNLDIFGLLSNLPIPGAAALGYLSGNQSLGCCGAYVYWNLLSASIDVNIVNKQCFDFTPKVYGDFQFPVPVEYSIIDGVTGAVSPSDTSSYITVELGDELQFNFPCYFQDIEITPTYWIDGIIRNHTYDSIPVDFLFSSLAFGVVIPEIELIPAITTPEICIGYPCGWFDWCTACWDPPDIPAVTIDPPDVNVGPLIDLSVPITAIKYDWFDETWSLDGFDTYTKPPFSMHASLLGASNVQTDVLCFGDNTGAIDVSFSAISPALPFTYTWSNGATSEDLTGLAAGQYELSAYDANGCQHFTGATILEPASPVSVTPTVTDMSCNGLINDGSASLLIQGGMGPYNVVWSNGMTGASITGLAAGVYTATVTDDNGCVLTESIVVDEPTPLGQTGAVTHVNCNGGNDGAIDISSFGGTLPYSFSWNTASTTEDISGLTAGSYTMTVTDAKGCTSTETYIVDEPNNPITLTTTGVDILCKYDSTGAVDLTVNGGTPGYTFVWSNSTGVVLPYQTEDLNNVPAEAYTVVVTDNNNCIESISITLIEPVNELLSTPTLIDINCNGDFTGVIDPVISGGTIGYNYVWSNGSTSSVNNGLSAGTYSLTLTDANGCVLNESYTLIEPTPLVLATSNVDVLCNGDATGEVSVEASGATPGYNYVWSNGVNTPTASGVPAGAYSVTVTDQNGCSEVETVVVNEPVAPISVSYVTTDIDCFGNANGTVDMQPTGGTAPYSYVWSTSGSVIMTDTTQDLSGLIAGTYLVTITDDHGCTLNSSTTINQPAAPLSIQGTTDSVSCFAGSNGAIDITVNGGTINYSYLWDNGVTTQDLTGVSSGTYSVVVTDANGCTISDNYTVLQPDEPVTSSVEATDVKCIGGSDGFILSSVSGGIAPYTYLWSNGATTPNITNIPAGTYTLTVTDANGCTSFTGATVNEPTSGPTLTFTTNDVSCFGGSDGLIGMSASGGTLPLYYNWGTGESILFSQEGDTLNYLSAGDYIIIVTDANGCQFRDTATINEPTLLVTENITVDNLCFGDAAGLIDVTNSGGTPPYSVQWSTGQTSEDLTDLFAGWYYYEVTDANNCKVKDSAEILEPSRLWHNSIVTYTSCIDVNDGSIEVEVGGGVPPYDFVWDHGAFGPDIYNLEPGDYQVIFYDANDCSDTIDYVIYGRDTSCIDIPNTFTPDGDLYNDTWVIGNIDLYPNAMVVVYNKWGNEIFKSQGQYTPWDGTVNGRPLPSEVYYYIIVLNNSTGEEYTGTITIVR